MFNRDLITRFLLRRPAALEPGTDRATILALAATVLPTLGVPARAGHGPAPVPSRSGGAER
jgi:hypothetical protein